MNITIVGAGYVGLVTGACLADVGNKVLCLDSDKSKITQLKNGCMPIYEPGLSTLVEKNQRSGRLKFTHNIEESVDHGDAQFIAVGTPPEEDGSADLNHVLEAARNIGKYMKDHNLEAQIDYVQPLTYIGKNTLFFYMLHIIPCIIWSSNFKNY